MIGAEHVELIRYARRPNLVCCVGRCRLRVTHRIVADGQPVGQFCEWHAHAERRALRVVAHPVHQAGR